MQAQHLEELLHGFGVAGLSLTGQQHPEREVSFCQIGIQLHRVAKCRRRFRILPLPRESKTRVELLLCCGFRGHLHWRGRRSLGRLYNLENLVGLGTGDYLFGATRPLDLNLADRLFPAQSKVQAPVAGRKVAAGRRYCRILHFSFGAGESNLGANRIAVALRAAQVENDPVIAIAAVIAQKMGGTVEIGDHDIDVAIVIEIAERGAPCSPGLCKNVTSRPRNIRELVAGVLQQQRRFERAQVRLRHFDVVHHMAVGEKNFLGRVIVVIERVSSPAGVGARGSG